MQRVQETEPTRPRALLAAAAVLLLGATCGGCRSRAHTDLYIDQMAAEIRVLEDQLYKCDYENEVLHQKLQRARARLEAGEVTKAELDRRQDAPPARRRGADDPAASDATDVELGVPKPPDIDPQTPQPPDVDLESFAPPAVDDGQEVPVGKNPAEELPPLTENRIPIAPGIHKLYDQPGGPVEKLVIDPILSSGKTADDDGTPTGIRIVLKAFDREDRATTIDEAITVSLLDPARQGPEARLGLWKFSVEQLEKYRSEGTAQLAIDLEWTDSLPEGDSVLCFVRIERDDKSGPVADQILPIRNDQALTGDAVWAPRG